MSSLFLNVAMRAALIAAGTASILWALRIRTPAVRHMAWTTVLITMLLLPIWSLAGPKVPLAVLPADPVSSASGSRADSDQSRLAHQSSATPPGAIMDAAHAGSGSAGDMWESVLIGAYVLGALALLVRLAIGTVHAHRLRRGAVMHAGLATSPRCATPITVGWLSPVLILPEGWDRWSAAQLDAVLTHEHEHARRRDPLVQWFALLNRAIFWFHPLAWWLERRLATLAEEACDAAVIRAGHSPQDYSGYLIDMARVLRRQGRRLNVAGMAMPGSGLQDRMRHIFEEAPMTSLSRTRVICMLAFCTTSSVIFAAGVLAPRTLAVVPLHASAIAPGHLDIALVAPPPNTPVSATPIPNPPAPDASETRQPESPTPVPAVSFPTRHTDFSGTWTHVSSTYAGRGRGGSGGEGLREVQAIFTSGGAINCGLECTIVQDAGTLTVTVTSTPPNTTPPDGGEVVLNIDGRDTALGRPNSLGHIAKAEWDGDKLVVTRYIETTVGQLTCTQTLSIEGGTLTLVSQFNVSDAPTTMTYVKR